MRSAIKCSLAIAVSLLYSALILYGLVRIPFHPDETSLLYQSRDLELIFSDPTSLSWEPGRPNDDELTYRVLNAPLGKYVLGVGRLAAGYGAGSVSVDWNWSQTWEQNVAAGALPEEGLLLAGRFAATLLLPVGLIFLYKSGLIIADRTTATLAVIFLATNATILLHGRRAMAEGTLTFGMCLAIFGILLADRHPWLNGLAFAVALSAKYSAAALFPVCLLASAWTTAESDAAWRQRTRNVLVFLLTAVAVAFLLHPILWTHPLQASQQMWLERNALLQAQTNMMRTIDPGQVLDTPFERLVMMLAHVYLAPLQFAEVGNYLAQTSHAVQAYLSVPWNGFFRGALGGGMLLALSLFGFAVSLLQLRIGRHSLRRRALTLLLAASLAQAAGLLLANPLPFQRYYVPLLPFVALWSAFGIGQVLEKLKQAIRFPDSLFRRK